MIWFHAVAGGFTPVPISVNADYITRGRPTSTATHRDDIVWYGPGTVGDSVWFGEAGGTFSYQVYAVNRTYTPVTVDLDGTGRDVVIWYAPGPSLRRDVALDG